MIYLDLDHKHLDSNLPIGFDELKPLIIKINNRYPILSEMEISYIVNSIFYEIRKQLLLGNKINIQEFLFGAQLLAFCKLKSQKVDINTKVQVSTPGKLNERA